MSELMTYFRIISDLCRDQDNVKFRLKERLRLVQSWRADLQQEREPPPHNQWNNSLKVSNNQPKPQMGLNIASGPPSVGRCPNLKLSFFTLCYHMASLNNYTWIGAEVHKISCQRILVSPIFSQQLGRLYWKIHGEGGREVLFCSRVSP